MEDTRKCSCCKIEKPLSEFYKIKNGTSGVRPACKECSAKKEREKYGENAEFRWSKLSKQAQKLRDDPEFLAKHRMRTRRWHLKKHYGITLEQFDGMLKEQNNCCAICGSTSIQGIQKTRMVVDHCHKTGKTRGLLCDLCNTALGKFKDSHETLTKAIEYLKKWQT